MGAFSLGKEGSVFFPTCTIPVEFGVSDEHEFATTRS